MKQRERGPDKPEQVTADIAYEILLELKKLNKTLEEQKKKWPKR